MSRVWNGWDSDGIEEGKEKGIGLWRDGLLFGLALIKKLTILDNSRQAVEDEGLRVGWVGKGNCEWKRIWGDHQKNCKVRSHTGTRLAFSFLFFFFFFPFRH
jgi:hypothetical protein